MHAGSSDIGRYPDVATAALVGDHTTGIPVRIPDIATVDRTDDPDKPVLLPLLFPVSIRHVRRTTANGFPKFAHRVAGLA